MDSIEEIKNRLDIVDLVSESGVELRRAGRSYTGFCPFHSNTRTPSFVVFPESQTWRCFGACADGGDVFSFTMRKYGWDFKEALRELAKRAGVTLQEYTPAQKAKKAEADQRLSLLEAAADYFHQILLHAPQAERARGYLQQRSLTSEAIATFKLGFSLNAWDAVRTHFTSQGYSEQELLEAGLLTENEERGTRYDRFRNRLMFPIRNARGETVGFGARTLDPDGIPKYLNSPQTEAFNKSHLLYGLDTAKRHVREARQVVIVEGYMDVIGTWQAGYRNVVAQMGTALTREQLQLLQRYTKRFVIALDADAAGVKATLRSLEVARGSLDREVEVRFDAPNLVRHEGRLQADIRVVTMPEGEDPDSLVRHDKGAWPKLIDQARPIVEYVVGVLTQAQDVNDPKVKAAVARRVIPLIQDVVNSVERDHYWQFLARTLGVQERSLRQMAVQERNDHATSPNDKASQERPQPDSGTAQPEFAGTEFLSAEKLLRKRQAYFLRQCIEDAALIHRVNDRLEASGTEKVKERDFADVDDKAIFTCISSYKPLQGSLLALLQKRWPNRVEQLIEIPPETKNNIHLPIALARLILILRSTNAKQQNEDIKALLLEDNGDNKASYDLYLKEQVSLLKEMKQIDRSKKAMSEVAGNYKNSPFKGL